LIFVIVVIFRDLVTFVFLVTFVSLPSSETPTVAIELDDQFRRYRDLVKRASDLRSYL
jgi:hypothetical protein